MHLLFVDSSGNLLLLQKGRNQYSNDHHNFSILVLLLFSSYNWPSVLELNLNFYSCLFCQKKLFKIVWVTNFVNSFAVLIICRVENQSIKSSFIMNTFVSDA